MPVCSFFGYVGLVLFGAQNFFISGPVGAARDPPWKSGSVGLALGLIRAA